jgi:hypothetical protein
MQALFAVLPVHVGTLWNLAFVMKIPPEFAPSLMIRPSRPPYQLRVLPPWFQSMSYTLGEVEAGYCANPTMVDPITCPDGEAKSALMNLLVSVYPPNTLM